MKSKKIVLNRTGYSRGLKVARGDAYSKSGNKTSILHLRNVDDKLRQKEDKW